MKRAFLLIIALCVCLIAFTQEAQVGDNSIQKIDDKEYTVKIAVTPKKATTLLVETIKARANTVLVINKSFEIAVDYVERQYVVEWSGSKEVVKFTKVSEARKFTLNKLREQLGIT